MLAEAVGCKQCKQLAEAAVRVRALIEPSVAHSTKSRLAMNLLQACAVTKPLPSEAELPGMTRGAPTNSPKNNTTEQLSEEQSQAKHATTTLAINPLHAAVRDG